jgi:uncharacterized membrane protein (UPF0127 family)
MFMLLDINNSSFNVKVVVSEKEVQRGMMGKKFNEKFNGMLFIMEGDEHCFWMKNCITNLDIIFIEDNIITKIHRNCPPCTEEECQNYCGKGEMVLEVQGGTCKSKNIQEGDLVEF